MTKFFSTFAALALFGSFTAASGTFASTRKTTLVESAAVQNQQDATSSTESCGTQTMQCTVTWKADSAVCKSQNTTSNCITKYQGEHATPTEAKERCESIHGVKLDSGVLSCGPCWVLNKAQGDCLEQCKELCYKLWEKCRDNCPRKDRNCLSECTNELARCNRECERKCKGR